MRRRKLTELIFDNYCLETEEMKERCQETVFEYYYDRNNMQLEEALDEIASDIKIRINRTIRTLSVVKRYIRKI